MKPILLILMSVVMTMSMIDQAQAKWQLATFAGGCFWCMEPPFAQLPGVKAVTVGYTGGTTLNPSYEEVCSGSTGHLEAVQVEFDPAVISYRQLVEIFWQQIDPTDDRGQFADQGSQYHTAIFYHNPEQAQQAEAAKQALQSSGKFGKPVVTRILPAQAFYPAEGYHQAYYRKNSEHYRRYKFMSGREEYLRRVWQKKDQPTKK